MNKIEKEIAAKLMEIKAIKLSPDQPFTWASGWKSPIYCDNRKILSYPEIRKYIVDRFVDLISTLYEDYDVIAGVATGAIAHGVLVAEKLKKPFIYIRSSSKGHGLENKIEGVLGKNQKVLVIEDLISTGGSSLAAVEALREAQAEVVGMVAIFTYGFEKAKNNFEAAKCNLDTLSNYNALIDMALDTHYITQTELETLKQWRQSPDTWKQ